MSTDEPRPSPDRHGPDRHGADRQVSGRDRHMSARLFIGIAVIGLGLILLASNLGLLDIRHVIGNAWPLIFVYLGVRMLGKPEKKRSRAYGWVFITVGLWVFLDRIGWIDLSIWQYFFPGAIIVAGSMLVYRALNADRVAAEQRNDVPSASADHAEFIRCFAVMSGSELRPISRPFRGADLSAVMAGIKLDLTDARMEGESATIEVFSFWGGLEIYVPPDWTVTSKVATFMGGFIDKRRPTSVIPTKTLYIDGIIIMSAVEIKN